ncbi:short chain dehydrogenase [Paenarthrobacter sp. NPDC058040]|uniref:short chain dehydrogenase n=1 Tax=unclassified Paenarthrobacter TaxID=2634190 RepID=UPI0036D853DB
MRILIVGSTGLLGTALARALGAPGQGHEILGASRRSVVPVDLTDPVSIGELYRTVGEIDAVVCAAGSARKGALADLSFDDTSASLGDKLLGQIELVRQGLPYVANGGSFTLVSGITAYEPIRDSSLLAAVNSGIDGFVRGAAVGLPRGIRINSVSASVFSEAWDAYGADFPGFAPVSTAEVARAFVKSVEGVQTGQTYRVGF